MFTQDHSPSRPRFSRRLLGVPLLLLTWAASPAAVPSLPAGPPAPARAPSTRPARDPAAQTARWFAELGHPDAGVRDAARVGLMGLPRRDLPALERVVRQSIPLVPAQAIVLREIVTHVFLSGERYDATSGDGFLGVKPAEANLNFREPPLLPADPDEPPFGPLSDPGAVYGVVIVERFAGFAGARALQDGDVILSMLEQPELQFRIPFQFSQVVKAVSAGKTIHFQVLRQGQIIRVPVTLDPRPDAADFQQTMAALLGERKKAAEEYWERVFAPLLKEEVS